MRSCFNILSITTPDGAIAYRCPEPNSVNNNRGISNYRADENCKSSLVVCTVPIEHEKQWLEGKILRVEMPSGVYRKFSLEFPDSMVDDKWARVVDGLCGSSSNYLCTLCDATRDTAVTNLGSHTMNRTHQQAVILGNIAKLNPDKLKGAELTEVLKGISHVPLSYKDPVTRGFDTTHCNISMGNWFYQLLYKIKANANHWTVPEELKELFNSCKTKLDKHLKSELGLSSGIMMVGNFARELFKAKNEKTILNYLDEADRADLSVGLSKFRELQIIYSTTEPSKTDIATFKEKAVAFGRYMLDTYPWANWPNYMHKLIEHGQEIMVKYGTLAGMSGEGNEALNKVFRKFVRDNAFRGNMNIALQNVLTMTWLSSSPELVRLAEYTKSQHLCSICLSPGHNKLTCEYKED